MTCNQWKPMGRFKFNEVVETASASAAGMNSTDTDAYIYSLWLVCGTHRHRPSDNCIEGYNQHAEAEKFAKIYLEIDLKLSAKLSELPTSVHGEVDTPDNRKHVGNLLFSYQCGVCDTYKCLLS